MLEFMIIAAILGGILIYRRGGLRLPAMAGLSGGIMSSSKQPVMVIGAVAIFIAAALIWWFWESIVGLSFFWKLILAVAVAFIGWKFLKGTLGTLVLTGGVIAILAVLLFSNPGTAMRDAVDSAAEQGGTSASLWGCPDEHKVKAGDTFVLTKTCPKVNVRFPYGQQDLELKISNSRFSGYFEDWAHLPWDKKEAYLLNVTMYKWPEGENEVTVEVLSAAEAAKNNAVADAATVERALSGATQ